jgi:hypothetical protein
MASTGGEMNKEKMLTLAKHLESLPKANFNMAKWAISEDFSPICLTNLHTCGTTCCIAGYQVLLNPDHCILCERVVSNTDVSVGFGGVERVAADELGLSEEEKDKLFYMSHWPKKMGKSHFFENTHYLVPMFPETPKGAAKRIRYMVRTGE